MSDNLHSERVYNPPSSGDLALLVRESNKIEGVPDTGEMFDRHMLALKASLRQVLEDGSLLHPRVIHLIMFNGMETMANGLPARPGEYRQDRVMVGGRECPHPLRVPEMMKELWQSPDTLQPWILHNWFEKIHPFPDGNGRAGRCLLWASQRLHKEELSLITYEDRMAYYSQIDAYVQSISG